MISLPGENLGAAHRAADIIRGASAERHHRLEKRLNLLARVQTRDDYRELLERFFGFYSAVEEALASFPEWEAGGLSFESRLKTPLLRADLEKLGAHPDDIARLSRYPFPRPALFSEAVGTLYVLEGSTLGGQFLSRYFQEKLGLTREMGLSFYLGYESRTGAMWQTFKTFLENHVNGSPDREKTVGEIVDAVDRCYGAVEQWLCGNEAGPLRA